MKEFLSLFGNLFFIACIQVAAEALLSGKKQVYLVRVLSTACYLGSFYLVLQFMVQHLFREMAGLFRGLF